jgi:Tol biopolymer transport system component
MIKVCRTALVVSLATAVSAAALAAGASAAFPGANGRIAYVEDLPPLYDTDQIFTIQPSGAGVTQLTGGDENLDPAYSSDGEKIVFARDPAGAPDEDIWVMNHDGSGQTQLTSDPTFEDTDPGFSPDGTRIVFQRDTPGGDDQVFVMNADGTGVTQLTFPGPDLDEGFEPSFSPDGRLIVLRRDRTGSGINEIYVMNPDGSGQRAVTTGSATVGDFRPDTDVFSVSLADGSLRQLTSGPGDDFDPVFSPDGLRIAFSREDGTNQFGDLLLADSTGLDQDVITLLSDQPNEVFFYNPSWQPLNSPSCDVVGPSKSKSYSQITVTVTCSNENATAVLGGTGKAAKVPKGATASKKKKFTIPPVTVQVPQDTPTSVALTIPKKGKKALKKAAKAGKKGTAIVTATLTDDLGQASQDAFAVKFKKKK